MAFTELALTNSVSVLGSPTVLPSENIQVFRNIFSAVNYPRLSSPPTWCTLSPSLLLAVTLSHIQCVCTLWLLSAFPRPCCVSFPSSGSLGKTAECQGQTTAASRLFMAPILPTILSLCTLEVECLFSSHVEGTTGHGNSFVCSVPGIFTY